jgi:multimeric flavodoxin WrbA
MKILGFSGSPSKEMTMGQSSKNARTSSATQKFFCSSCGGEVRMKTLFESGKFKNIAECEKCKRTERRPSDFR